MSFLDKTGLARLWTNISALADTKVDKVNGKGLSTNDFTDAYKDAIDNMGEGGGGGADIDYGPSLPANGSEGDVFLLTDSAGQTFTETIPVESTYYGNVCKYKLSNKIQSITNVTYDDQNNYPIFGVENGMLTVHGDLYNPMNVTITYVSDGRWVTPTISDTVVVSAASFATDISDAILKATDSGNCITVLIDYSLASSGEESWTFQVSNGQNKTFLAAYALSGNGLVGCSSGEHFGVSLNNLSLYFVDGVPRFSGSKAALVIYYA